MAIVAASCSTTRILQDDECRLVENKIVITNDDDYSASSLLPYIKQKPNDYFKMCIRDRFFLIFFVEHF